MLVFALLLQSLVGWTQTDRLFSSAYNSGMLSVDRFSTDRDVFPLQPSLLPLITQPHISAHMQSRFTGFDIYALGLHMATTLPKNFGTGLSLFSLGHLYFNTVAISLSVGKQLSKHASIGISQRIQRTRLANEGRPWTGSSTIAGSYDNGKWGLAMHLTGLMPWGQTYNPGEFSIQAGAYVGWSTQTRLYFSIDYLDAKIYPVTGIRQTLMKNIEVFGAFQWYPARYGLGFLVPLTEQIECLVSTQYHPVLGWSPSIGLQWHEKVKGESRKKRVESRE